MRLLGLVGSCSESINSANSSQDLPMVSVVEDIEGTRAVNPDTMC
jgi:hypothetical protein